MRLEASSDYSAICITTAPSEWLEHQGLLDKRTNVETELPHSSQLHVCTSSSVPDSSGVSEVVVTSGLLAGQRSATVTRKLAYAMITFRTLTQKLFRALRSTGA